MGNLSCVSCRTADVKERGPSANKKSHPLSKNREKSSPENELRASNGQVELDKNHISSGHVTNNRNHVTKDAGTPSCHVAICEASPTNEKPPVIRSPEDVTISVPSTEKRVSGWELYEVLRQHRIKEEDDNGLPPLEKAAKAIVDINVFLASQVIYPAYLRYLEEDFPEMYIQYFQRPDSPTPPYMSEEEISQNMEHAVSSAEDSRDASPCSEAAGTPG